MTADLITLLSFNGITGANPYGSLIADANGDLFGTTADGSGQVYGTVFELIQNDVGGYTPLLTFDGSNGAKPRGSLIADANGDLFGTTASGGANGNGTVFELIHNNDGGYTPTTLLTFDGSNGAEPWGSLIADADGDLFGTTAGGGANGKGTVFELENNNDGSYMPITLLTFDGSNGANPYGSLIADANGDLFGTTASGGANGKGTVFKLIHNNDGGYTPITLLTFDGSNGANPRGSLIADANGNLFGTTINGGARGLGTVFELIHNDDGSYTPTTLVFFDGSNGANPYGSLIADANGDLFGTTARGGTRGDGTVFELIHNDDGSYTPTTLVFFNYRTTGAYPFGSLIADANGNLFGTTSGGGPSVGTVFEIPNSGFFSLAHDTTSGAVVVVDSADSVTLTGIIVSATTWP